MMESFSHKLATPDFPVNQLIVRRFSPYTFKPEPLADGQLQSLLEAARWAPSSYNEQPWRYLIAQRSDETAFNAMVQCLVPGNQDWATHASVLMIGCVKRQFSKNGKPNRCAEHDLGQASAFLSLQATAMGLYVHQMQGIDQDRCRQQYDIPEGFDPWTGIAIGHVADADQAADGSFADRDGAPRQRQPIDQFAFAGEFGQPFKGSEAG